MPLHRDAIEYLRTVGQDPPWADVGIDLARERRAARNVIWKDTVEPVFAVHELAVDGPAGPIPIRVYRPAGTALVPVLVYLHGGGWVLGNLEQVDALCRMLCNRTPALVVSVDYRLAPESRFPIAAEEAYAVLQWASQHAPGFGGDGGRLMVGGDSSGGNLAVAGALMACDRGSPGLAAMLLAYPVCRPDFDTASYREYAAGYGLTRDDMRWFWSQYLASPDDRTNPYAVPLARADFSGLPATLIIVAEYDPLRDEGEALAERLRQDGVLVRTTLVKGMVHGFFASAWAATHRRQTVEWVALHLQRLP
ncbi:MAG: alpha/beta hydrolase [Thermaerobacter sp.]|nr:alpha/beta hydrolase [Thermaerobacter sp.]